MEPLETAVLEKLLNGDHPILVALKEQMSGLSVKARKYTGAGFFTEFSLALTAHRLPASSSRIRFGDVEATIDGLNNGAGFVLFIDDGLLHMLEGYSYDEPWPKEIHGFSVKYSNADRKAELAKLD